MHRGGLSASAARRAMPSDKESPKLQPFAAMPGSALAGLRVLVADIDDTITAGGKLPARTLELFEELEAVGLVVVLVTGRSAGWAQALAGYLPGVRLVVGENGLVSSTARAGGATWDRRATRLSPALWPKTPNVSRAPLPSPALMTTSFACSSAPFCGPPASTQMLCAAASSLSTKASR